MRRPTFHRSLSQTQHTGWIALLGLVIGCAVGCGEGDAGPPGPNGAPGVPGPQGPTGPVGEPGSGTIFVVEAGRYVPATPRFNESAAEITAFDPTTNRVFVVNADRGTVDVLDLTNPALPTLVDSIETSTGTPNSVAVSGGVVAVAIERVNAVDDSRQENGLVAFYQASDLTLTSSVTVGPLPDMVTFTPDGERVLVANEGEPNNDLSFNPEGSISVIDVRDGFAEPTVVNVGFEAFNVGQARADEFPSSIRQIFAGATRSQELEPEYIAVSADGQTAFVTLQEHNALAVVDVATATEAMVLQVLDLGAKNHTIPGNELDASNEDNGINLRTWPVFGLYQPDAIAAYEAANGKTYLVTANEGDAVEYGDFVEEARISTLTLDATAFPDAATLQADANLGRLLMPTTIGDDDGDGEFERLFCYGGRSFSIWDASTGRLVFDSGNDFERITAVRLGMDFNATDDSNGGDARSDDKGPEPEGVVVGQVDGRFYAFIGLERVGGIMVYDVTQPESPMFVQYVNNRDFAATDMELAQLQGGDLGPEGLTFVGASDSPNGRPLLVVGNEISGTTTVYEILTVDNEYSSEQVLIHGVVSPVTRAGTRQFYSVALSGCSFAGARLGFRTVNRKAIILPVLLGAAVGSACATSPTGRRQLLLFPEGQVAQLGAQAYSDMKKQQPLNNDPSINRYVACVTNAIIASNRNQLPGEWEVTVFADEQANAFALPGGKIGVFTGLLRVADNADQLAAVIGHEVGHVVANHGNERMSSGAIANLGMSVLSAYGEGGENRQLLVAALGIGYDLGVAKPHSRGQESEADNYGLALMANAGFDPASSIQLWKNMGALGQAPPEILSTHPSPATRIQNLTNLQTEAQPLFQKARAAGRKPNCIKPKLPPPPPRPAAAG